VELLLNIVEYDPSLMRAFILTQSPKYDLLRTLIDLFNKDHENSLQQLITEVLRHLLDLTSKRDEVGII
jgi:hypothetical protein